MSYQYEQAVLQRDSFGNKTPNWLTIGIIGFIFVAVIVLTASLVGNSSSKSTLIIEFQKTLFEQNNELMQVNAYLSGNQIKDKRYFFKLNKYANQINHRFEIISEFISDNNLEVDQKKFDFAEKSYRKKLDSILNSKKELIEYHQSLEVIRKTLPKFLTINTEINSLLLKNSASNNHVYFVTRQLFLIERITSNIQILSTKLRNSSLILASADRLGRDMALLIRVYRGLLKGNYKMNVAKINNLKIRNELNKVIKLSENTSKDVSNILRIGPSAFQFIEMRNGLVKNTLTLQANYQSLFFVSN